MEYHITVNAEQLQLFHRALTALYCEQSDIWVGAENGSKATAKAEQTMHDIAALCVLLDAAQQAAKA